MDIRQYSGDLHLMTETYIRRYAKRDINTEAYKQGQRHRGMYKGTVTYEACTQRQKRRGMYKMTVTYEAYT